MDKFFTILGIVKKYRDILYIIAITIIIAILCSKCSNNNALKNELKRQKNNELAMKDTLATYVDELGRTNAEKHTYQLTQAEFRDSINGLKKKNYEYVSYINTQIGIKDTIYVNCIVERVIETSRYDSGTITIDTLDTFGKSGRHIVVNIPYVMDTALTTGKSMIFVEHDVFVEGWIERNTKTKETFIHLRSDYPGISFNSGMGIVAETSKQYDRSMRKVCGVGMFIGPSIGYGYTFNQWRPYVGISVGFGLTLTPRWAQW